MMSKLPKKPTIQIDTREKAAHRLFQPSEAGDKDVAAYVVEKLESGDYSIKEIPDLVVVERKMSGRELWQNLTSGKETFLRMIERMRQFRHRYIVIEQSYDEFLDPKSWAFVRPYKKRFVAMAMVESWLISLSQSEGIHFIWTGHNTARITRRILLKSYEYEKRIQQKNQKL